MTGRDIQLIRRVLADPAFSAIEKQPQYDSTHFQFYRVDLPYPAYRGLPPRWEFAILRDDKGYDVTSIMNDCRRLAELLPINTPLLLISDFPGVVLEENVAAEKRNIFCVDASDLLGKPDDDSKVNEVLRGAIRRRLSAGQVSPHFSIVPYRKGEPATGWRFHGRRRELQQLLGTPQSYVIIGGRRIGKTSLMLEANRRLQERGETAFYLSVEECRSASDVVKKLLIAISPRDGAAAVRHSRALDEGLLVRILKQLTSKGPITLFLDELGNVLLRMSPEDWSFLGVLRQFSHQGRLRFVISCFQEYFLRQQEEFSGPLINFAAPMRLGAFSRSDIEEFVLSPLESWLPLGESREIVKRLVISKVGSHPRFLQAFCYDLFERITQGQNVLDSVHSLLGRDLAECFHSSINEVFWQRNSSLLNYLFLKRCRENDRVGGRLAGIEITDDWAQAALRELGYEASLLDLRNLLEGMEFRGFTCRARVGFSGRQVIVAPVIYYFFATTEPDLDRLLSRLAYDAQFEVSDWKLRRINSGVLDGQ